MPTSDPTPSQDSRVEGQSAEMPRLQKLAQTGLLDSVASEAFDRLTRLASTILNIPVTLVSLVDQDRQFFKSQVGLPEPWAGRRETPLTHSFCKHVVASQEPLVVVDARLHPLVSENLAVSELGVVAYAGMPLTTSDGYTLGAFCAIDGQPREWSEHDLAILRDLAALTITEIELALSLRLAREQAEQAELGQRQNDLLLQSMGQGVYGLDQKGRCTFINAAAQIALGYSAEELLGHDMHKLIHHTHADGDDYSLHDCPIRRAGKSGKVGRGDDEVYWKKDGTHFPVEYVASPVITSGEVHGVVVTFSDISQRKDMLRRLAVQHAISGVLSESSGFADAAPKLLEAIGEALQWQVGSIWKVDAISGVLRSVVTWSAKGFPATMFREATTGLTFGAGEGLPGRVWQSRAPLWSSNLKTEMNFPRASIADKEGLHSALCFPILLGGTVTGVIELFSVRTHEADDELIRTVSTAGRQIGEFTARKKAELALQESEARKAIIFAAAPDAMISIDHEGYVLEWNPAAERMFGYSRTDVLNREMAALIIPEEYRQRHRQGMRHLLATGEGPVLDQRLELSALRADGSEFPIELIITQVQQDGHPTFFGFVRDITERQKSEQTLYESERFANGIVDSLSSEIAILDEQGIILKVNSAWIEFAQQDGTSDIGKVGVGANYLEVCDRAAARGSTDAEATAQGIRAVIQGDLPMFEREYPCHAPDMRRWFIARITRFSGEGPLRVVIAHENISKRKLAELEQKRLAQYNQMLLDSTGEGIYGVDTEGGCTFLNRAAARILGRDADEALGQNMHDLTHHSHVDGSPYVATECPIYNAFRSGSAGKTSGEVFWRADGTSFPVEYSSYPLTEHGTVHGAVVVFTDVSERVESERQLQLMSLVASQTDNAVIITGKDRLVEWVNDGFVRITGYTLQEAIGRRPGQLLQGPLTDPKTVERIRQRLDEKRSFTEEIVNYRKNGQPYWLSLNITPVLNAGGDVQRYIAIESDISQRKQEEARQQEQMRLASLLAEVGTAITQSDQLPEMLQRCAAAMVNHLDGAFARIWTLNAQEDVLELRASAGMYTHIDGPHGRVPVGKYKVGLIALNRKPHLTNAVVGDPQVSDQAWASREGMVAFAGYPLVVRENLVGVMGMFARQSLSNTTLQAMATIANSIALGIQRIFSEEAMMRSKEAAEEANQAKSQFLANMSHELRTPLNAVIMYSELLMEEADDEGMAGFLPDLDKIRNAGRHLLGLINNVLDLSKIEAGKMEVFVEDFDVAAIVDEVAATVRPLIDKKSNRLVVDCPPDVGFMHTDLTKVRQILFNLLSNASKFTENGIIGLTVRREVVTSGARIAFEVADDGIGMTPEQSDKLFRAFSQADASTTRKYGGTGLGLAITKRLCEMLGGFIGVESEIEVGSRFTAWIPAESKTPTPESTDESAGSDIEGSPSATASSSGGSNTRSLAIGSVEVSIAEPIADGEPSDAGVPQHAGEAERLTTVLVIDNDADVRDMMVRFLQREGLQAVTARDGDEGLKLARKIRPDIITLDVMMPQIDGWAVLSSLKADPELTDIPVIMMTMVDDRNLGYMLGASEYLTKPIDRSRLSKLLDKYRPRAADYRMLIVEDDADVRAMLCDALADQGWQVEQAANGREALERLAEAVPDLILLDLLMPEMDGFEFATELRNNMAWKNIPVAVITSKDLTAEDRSMLHGKVLKVLQKGVHTSQELLQEIRKLMHKVR